MPTTRVNVTIGNSELIPRSSSLLGSNRQALTKKINSQETITTINYSAITRGGDPKLNTLTSASTTSDGTFYRKRTSELPRREIAALRKVRGSNILCISIIDEDSEYGSVQKASDLDQWIEKALNNEFYAFVVLVPFNGLEFNPPSSPNYPLGIPSELQFYITNVTRPGSGGTNSDYYEIIQAQFGGNGFSWADVGRVQLLIDNSGSMTRSTVEPDVDVFKQDLSSFDIDCIEVSNGEENYIGPHLNQENWPDFY